MHELSSHNVNGWNEVFTTHWIEQLFAYFHVYINWADIEDFFFKAGRALITKVCTKGDTLYSHICGSLMQSQKCHIWMPCLLYKHPLHVFHAFIVGACCRAYNQHSMAWHLPIHNKHGTFLHLWT